MRMFRKLRDEVTLTTLSVLVIAAGTAAVAVAANARDSSPADSVSQVAETISLASLAVGDEADISLPGVGTATVARTVTGLNLVSATADPGWQVMVHLAEGPELEVRYSADDVHHDLNIELENDLIRVRSSTTTDQFEDEGTTVTSATTPTLSNLSSVPGGPTVQAVAVLDAGTVSYTVLGAQLSIVDVATGSGWSSTIEVAAGREVEVSFRNGGARVDLDLELEDDEVRVRIRDRRTDIRTETRVPVDG